MIAVPFAWKLAIAGIVVALIAGYVLWLRAENAGLRADLVVAERDAAIYAEANRRTTESFNRYIAEQEHAARVLAETLEAANRRAADHAAIRMEIDRAEPSGDCPVPPVIRDTLDRLQRLRDEAAGG